MIVPIAIDPTKSDAPIAVIAMRPKSRISVEVRFGSGTGSNGAEGRRAFGARVGVAIC